MARAGVEPRFESIEGVRVRYVRAGAGSAIVLIHGLASSIATWRDVLPALAREHDVVALDLPGFGASDQPPDLSFDLYPRLVPALLGRLGVSRAAFVGHSLGGGVSVMVAGRHPGRVERLALLDSVGFNLGRSDRPWMVRAMGSAASGLAAPLPLLRLLVRRALGQVFFDPDLVTDERIEEYLAPLTRSGALGSIRSLLSDRDDAASSFTEALSRVCAPTLVVWGREDRWAPVAHAARFAAAIPGARTVVLERCGHMPQEERPAETVALLREFLAGG